MSRPLLLEHTRSDTSKLSTERPNTRYSLEAPLPPPHQEMPSPLNQEIDSPIIAVAAAATVLQEMKPRKPKRQIVRYSRQPLQLRPCSGWSRASPRDRSPDIHASRCCSSPAGDETAQTQEIDPLIFAPAATAAALQEVALRKPKR